MQIYFIFYISLISLCVPFRTSNNKLDKIMKELDEEVKTTKRSSSLLPPPAVLILYIFEQGHHSLRAHDPASRRVKAAD